MTKTVSKKIWIECRKCKDQDPCLIYLPKYARKEFPSNYCFEDAMKGNGKKGRWKKPKWAETELTQ